MTERTLALLTIEYHNKDLLVLSSVLSNFIPLCLSHLFSVCSRSILLCSLATCFSVLSCCFALAQLSYIAPSTCFANFVVSPPVLSNPPSMDASLRNRIPHLPINKTNDNVLPIPPLPAPLHLLARLLVESTSLP